MPFTVSRIIDESSWNDAVNSLGGHPLQLWGWGELKSRYEWSAERLEVRDGERLVATAQVLLRRLPFPFRRLAYIPRGPQCAEADRAQALQAIADHVKAAHKPVALSIEPDWPQPYSPIPKGEVEQVVADAAGKPLTGWLKQVADAGFTPSDNTGLIPSTLIVDTTRDEDTILKELTSTTRQNVRKSMRAEGVRFGEVTSENDVAQVLAINRETARRAEFAVHSDEYHEGIRDLMGPASQLLAAWEGDEVIAFVWLVVSGTTAFELYGGVNPRGMKLRANYGLKFHAMKHVKAQGVSRYDFNGLLNDGISDFKRQFAKHEDLLIGTWDKPLSPTYPLFARALPLARSALKRGVPAARRVAADPRGSVGTAVRTTRAKVAARRGRSTD